jgi:Domain of unknown function (DUF4129)
MWRERTATLSFLVMESLMWFVLATVLAGGSGGDGPAYITVLVATLGGFGLARTLQRFELEATTLVGAGGAVSVLALLVMLNIQYNAGGSPLSLSWLGGFTSSPDGFLASRWPQTWGGIVVVAAWFRAVQVAQHDFTYNLVLGSFSVGLGLVVLVVLFGQASRVDSAINAAALPFFVAGLFALSLTQLRRAAQVDADFVRGPWLPVVLGTVGGLALVSIAIGAFPIDFFNRVLAPVGMLALRLLDVVILVIALPIGWLLTQIITRLLGREGFEWPRPNQLATQTAERVHHTGDQNVFAAFFLVVFKFLFVLAIAAVLAYVIYRIFRKLRRPSRGADEVRESVYREGGLGADLAALFRGMFSRMNRGEGLREPSLPAGILRLRRLYLRVLDDAAERGTVRPPPATPREFSPALTSAFDSPVPERLSERFAAGRYGRVEPSREELAALERAVGELGGPHPPARPPNAGRGGA